MKTVCIEVEVEVGATTGGVVIWDWDSRWRKVIALAPPKSGTVVRGCRLLDRGFVWRGRRLDRAEVVGSTS